MPPQVDELGLVPTAPPHPAAVHLVKRTPQNDHARILEFVKPSRLAVHVGVPHIVGVIARRIKVSQVTDIPITGTATRPFQAIPRPGVPCSPVKRDQSPVVPMLYQC